VNIDSPHDIRVAVSSITDNYRVIETAGPLPPRLALPRWGRASMSSEVINQITRDEWRELGFFYERDDEAKTWRIVGSHKGLQVFVRYVLDYASDAKNAALSEHIHLGPYMYLEIGTWTEPVITDHWIAGPLESLFSLATQAEKLIASAKVGEVLKFRDTFAPGSPYDLVLEVGDEAFDPAKADLACR
jgi:hypothetical protein